jgi:hypothetical protein
MKADKNASCKVASVFALWLLIYRLGVPVTNVKTISALDAYKYVQRLNTREYNE